jgi:predicted hydrocarbon binding protein
MGDGYTMVDDFRSLRDGLRRALLGQMSFQSEADSGSDDRDDQTSADVLKALLGALFARAGKGKDEVVQIIGREIGQAIAAMLREPLSKIAENQKLQISFELVPKNESRRKSRSKHKIHAKRSMGRSRKT